nr:TonB-dependent receptor plug domain-containing protein [uncultured Allomuricauda sp.]
MKTSILIFFFAVNCWTALLHGQTSDEAESTFAITCLSTMNENNQPLYIVDGTPVTDKEIVQNIDPDDVISVDILKGEEASTLYGKSGSNGVVIIQTKNEKTHIETKLEKLPFQVYSIKNDGWVIQQDIFNALRGRVPSLTISNINSPGSIPNFGVRGNDAPIILLDGIRVDASILNTLNPQDIESIHVAPSAAGTNYFLNGFRTY